MMRFKGEKWDLFGDIISGELEQLGSVTRQPRLLTASRDPAPFD